MGTSNFFFLNRCVVTTNEDYELNNLPKLGDWCNNNQNYSSKEVLIDELSCCKDYIKSIKPIRLHKIVLTSGYYEGGCIDFVRNTDDTPQNYIDLDIYYDWKTINSVIDEITNNFNITDIEIKTIVKNRMWAMQIPDTEEEDSSFYEYVMEDIEEKIIENEEIHCNKIIDLIKEKYGYEEYGCVAVASNGESLYNKID